MRSKLKPQKYLNKPLFGLLSFLTSIKILPSLLTSLTYTVPSIFISWHRFHPSSTSAFETLSSFQSSLYLLPQYSQSPNLSFQTPFSLRPSETPPPTLTTTGFGNILKGPRSIQISFLGWVFFTAAWLQYSTDQNTPSPLASKPYTPTPTSKPQPAVRTSNPTTPYSWSIKSLPSLFLVEHPLPYFNPPTLPRASV